MRIIENDNIVNFDVDGTLIVSCSNIHPDVLLFNYYGIPRTARPHHQHIEFLLSLKARGYYVRVHSANGVQWAKNVVITLGLEDEVDEVCTKALKTVDDVPYDEWMGPRIYIKEVEE